MAKKLTNKSTDIVTEPVNPPDNEDLYKAAEESLKQHKTFLDEYDEKRNNLINIDSRKADALEGEWADYGSSIHDKVTFNPYEGQLNEIRSEDQGFFEKIGLGIASAAPLTATTFIDNTVGFVYGLGSAVKNKDMSRLWDNDVTNAMKDLNDYFSEQMPFYKSRYGDEGLKYLGNFIGEDLLKNTGFYMGTAASVALMTALTGGSAGAGFLTKALTKFGMSAAKATKYSAIAKDLAINTISSIGESSVEALDNKRSFVEYQTQLLNDDYNARYDQIEREWQNALTTKYGGDIEKAAKSSEYHDYNQKLLDLDNYKKDREKFIQAEADKVGDITFLANMAILGGGNFLTFGKALSGGYGTTKRFADGIVTDIVDKSGKTLAKNVSEKEAINVIESGLYNGTAAKISERGLAKNKLIQDLVTMVDEGSQEMFQGVSSEWATGIAERDIMNYEALTDDQKSLYQVTGAINSMFDNLGELAKATGKVWTDPEQWRQFFGGAFGVVVAPSFSKGPNGKIKFALNNFARQHQEINEYNSTNSLIAEQINRQLNSNEGQNALKGLLRHKALDNIKSDAVANDDKMEYEDADFAQFVSDIATYSNAGKLGYLRASLNNMKNMTDEELEETCMNLCVDVNGKKVGEFVDNNGNFIANSDDARFAVREKINKRIDKLQKDIDLYQDAMHDIDSKTGGQLNTTDLSAFAWEKCNIANKYSRAKNILGSEGISNNIAEYKSRVGTRINTLTQSLNTTQDNLKLEKDKIMATAKKTGKEQKKSEYQKQLEEDSETLTQEIKLATEASQLLADLEMMQVETKNHKEDMNNVKTLFSKYKDFAESMPEVAKLMGVENKDDNSKDKKVISLEGIMRSGNFDKLMNILSNNSDNMDSIDDMSDDFADAAKLYRRAMLSEKSMEELEKTPTRYITGKDDIRDSIMQKENEPVVKEITDRVKKGIESGEITFRNLDAKSREITQAIVDEKNKSDEHANVVRKTFDKAMASLNKTPYEQLRQLAVKNILKDKKYKHLKEFNQFVNTIYLQIVSAQNVSDNAKKVAVETFNKIIDKKTTIDDVLDYNPELGEFDVKELYNEVPEEIKERRLNALRNKPEGTELPFDLSNYMYTEQSVSEAEVVRNEAFDLYDNVIEKYSAKFNGPKLSEDNEYDDIDTDEIERSGEAAENAQKIRDEREKLRKTIAKSTDIMSNIVSTFKDGQVLEDDDIEKLEKKIYSYVDKTFDPEQYSIENRGDVENLKLEKQLEALDILSQNIKDRISNEERASNDEFAVEFDKMRDIADEDVKHGERRKKAIRQYYNSVASKINEVVGKLDKVKKSGDTTIFSSAFDKFSTEDKSVAVKKSKEGYYMLDGKVQRGNLVPCKVKFYDAQASENLNAAYFKNPGGGYSVLIINNDGQVIGKAYTDNVNNTGEINNAYRVVPSTSLSAFASINLANFGTVTSPQQKRLDEKKAEEAVKILEEAGAVDEKGKVDPKNISQEAAATINVITDPNLVQSKADLEDVKLPSKTEDTVNKTKAKRKKAAKRASNKLAEQLEALDKLLFTLEQKTGYNGVYHNDSMLNSVKNFKAYIELVKDHYDDLDTKNVVLDTNVINSMVTKLTGILNRTFGKDVMFLSDEEINKNLTGNEQFSASEGNKNENLTFNVIDKAIESGEWNQEALDELNNLITDIKDGKKEYRRYQLGIPRTIQQKGWRSDETAVKASIILRGSSDTSSTEQRLSKLQRRKRDQETGIRQEQIVESWARSEGLWFEQLSDSVKGLKLLSDKSSESAVYIDEAKRTVTKVMSLSHFINPQLAIDRIILHNQFFPKAPIKIIGFGIDKNEEFIKDVMNNNNKFRIVIEQPFAKGIKPTIENIKSVVENFGLIQQKTPTTYSNPLFIASDLHEGNAIHLVDENDNPIYYENGEPVLAFIDTDMRLNTPDQGQNGEYHIDNSIVNTSSDNNGELNKENNNIYFSKQNGEIFGYTYDGKIAINKDKFRLDTPVHEYTHLWDKAVQKINPEFWKRGVELMKESAEWDKVVNDPSYANIKDNEDLVASEVHSRLAGYVAAGKMIELAASDRTKDKRNFWQKVVDWFTDFKNITLNKIFGMKKEDCEAIDLETFLNAPVADFFMQTDPRKIGDTSYQTTENKQSEQPKTEKKQEAAKEESVDDSIDSVVDMLMAEKPVDNTSDENTVLQNAEVDEEQAKREAWVEEVRNLDVSEEVEQLKKQEELIKDSMQPTDLPDTSILPKMSDIPQQSDLPDIPNATQLLQDAQDAQEDVPEIPSNVQTFQETVNKLEEQVVASFNVENIDGYDILEKAEKAEYHKVEMDTFKPAISKYAINDKTKSSLAVLGKNFEYIVNLYESTGAFDYVTYGFLSEKDDVFFGYGKVGEGVDNEGNKVEYNDVILFTKRDDGSYQMLGTLGYNGQSDPETARVLRDEIAKLASSPNRENYFDDIKIKTKKAAGNFASGQELGFKLLKHNNEPVKTSVSKILNGSLMYTKEHRSLKDVIMSNGVSIGNNIRNRNDVTVRVGFFDGGTKLKSNFGIENKEELDKVINFKNPESAQKGHVVYVIPRPDGTMQMIPLTVARFSDIARKADNDVVSQIRNVFAGMYQIYTSNGSISQKNEQLARNTSEASPIVQLRKLLHMNDLKLFFNENSVSIVVDGNEKKEFSPANQRDFENGMYSALKDCLININKKVIDNPRTLYNYILSDVFTTNLSETVHRNAFFTIKPVDSNGNKLTVNKDFPDISTLKLNNLKRVVMEVAKDDVFSYQVVEKQNGKFEVMSRIGDNFYDCTAKYKLTEQLPMINYAKLKNGIATGDNSYLEPECYVNGSNEPQELMIREVNGDKFYYEVSGFTQIPAKDVEVRNPRHKEEVKEEIPQQQTINKEEKATLEGKSSPLNEGEKKMAKEVFGTSNLKVLMASEHSDPVFHIDKLIERMNNESSKPFNQREFHMVQFMTKHDGLPLRRFLETKMPKTVHFSITSLGGTKWEPGVMKMDDMLDRIETFIKEGLLKPQQVTIRIDPIVPSVTKKEDIRHIVERASSMGIKMFKFSLMDSYGYTEGDTQRDRYIVQKMRELGYEWEKYYNIVKGDEVDYHPKKEWFDTVFSYMDNLADEFRIIFNTCGEEPKNANGKTYKHIKFNEGCLSVSSVENTLGVQGVTEDPNKRKRKRGGCSCFSGKIDALSYDDSCASSCSYCYAKHNSNAALAYYNEDGTLKNNRFTVTDESQLQKNDTIEFKNENFDIVNDNESQSLIPNRSDLYFDRNGGDETYVVKSVSDGNVTFTKTQWSTLPNGMRQRTEIEGSETTLPENEFRDMVGMDGFDISYSNEYGYAHVSYTGEKTNDGKKVYSLEISIPEDKNQGKGIGSKMYENIINYLEGINGYLTPGNVVKANHKWESLEKKGRVKYVELKNGETVPVAIPLGAQQQQSKTTETKEKSLTELAKEVLTSESFINLIKQDINSYSSGWIANNIDTSDKAIDGFKQYFIDRIGEDNANVIYKLAETHSPHFITDIAQMINDGILDSDSVSEDIINRILIKRELATELPDLDIPDNECL